MCLLLHYIFLIGACIIYFVISLHIEYSWLFPLYRNSERIKSFNDIYNSYDYVIVGAGSAGCVLAHRLSENKSMKVLLIEAGPMGSPLMDIPVMLPFLQRSSIDWQYQTTPQTNSAQSFNKFQINWPRGKIVGGSGRLNNMMHIRGHPNDYSGWFQSTKNGASLGSMEAILKSYWKRTENRHSATGPIHLSELPFRTTLSHKFANAMKEMRIVHRDVNTFYTGFDLPQVNVKNGARYSTGHYLLDQLHSKPNLHLLTNAEVVKVNLFQNREATSVTVVDNLKTAAQVQIHARHGIVLSAGSINTPKLLQLSGIGDPRELEAIGVPVTVPLQDVGRNLQDHVGATMDLVSVKKVLELNAISLLNPFTMFDYVRNGKGLYTTVQCEGMIIAHIDCLLNATQIVESFESCEQTLRDVPPDFQMMVLPLGMTTDYGACLHQTLGVNSTVYNEFYTHLHGTPTVLLVPVVLHPKSRGYVTIRSADPREAPLIEPNYFDDPYDADIILKGVRFMQKIVNTSAMRELGAEIDARPFPACVQHTYDSDEYWMCYIKHITLTIYHPVGTAALGKVVDFNFRVKGTSNLFVADGSVLPNLPSGNPNAVIVTAAEIASDHIKQDLWMSVGQSKPSDIFVVKHSTSIFT